MKSFKEIFLLLVFLLSSLGCFAIEKDSTAATQKDTVPAVKKDSEKMLLKTKRGAKLKKVRDPFDTTSKKTNSGLTFLSHFVLNVGGGWHFKDYLSNSRSLYSLYDDNYCYMISLEALLPSHLSRGLALEFSFIRYINTHDIKNISNNKDLYYSSYPLLLSFVSKYYFDYFKGYFYPFIKFGGILPITLEGGFGFTLKFYKNIYLNASYGFLEQGHAIPDVYLTNIFLVSLGYNFNFLPEGKK